ncbi:MAG: L-rhamnose isomerase, partial [Pseudoflavonifractor sp.]
ICCRKIGAQFGRALGTPCVTNHWIPDGSKDIRVDTLGPRQRLIESLDRIFAVPIDPRYNIDSVEGKVFGLGVESYTVGSHDFYSNYVLSGHKAIICMDTGHFHPTESVAAKLSAFFAFGQDVMLHLSRPVRWDSDHVPIVGEDTVSVMQEIRRCNAFDRVHIGLDFFDASIHRIAASVIGARSVKKAILVALLEPVDLLRAAETRGDLTKRLALLEEFKLLPAGIVFDEYCTRHGVRCGNWMEALV